MHSNSSDDLPCTDEIKVYQDEGEDSDEQAKNAENLAEEKVELVIESEGQKEEERERVLKFRKVLYLPMLLHLVLCVIFGLNLPIKDE
ncbi:T-cell specific, HMG-box [Cichlidogyrus casuarinus]|uniref:T-cell specific, HMG-box n=1 Tax=Cichlidogyrus casuarinus TaxID=1844966 RepID=A0ABD2QHU4_9PLAT